MPDYVFGLGIRYYILTLVMCGCGLPRSIFNVIRYTINESKDDEEFGYSIYKDIPNIIMSLMVSFICIWVWSWLFRHIDFFIKDILLSNIYIIPSFTLVIGIYITLNMRRFLGEQKSNMYFRLLESNHGITIYIYNKNIRGMILALSSVVAMFMLMMIYAIYFVDVSDYDFTKRYIQIVSILQLLLNIINSVYSALCVRIFSDGTISYAYGFLKRGYGNIKEYEFVEKTDRTVVLKDNKELFSIYNPVKYEEILQKIEELKVYEKTNIFNRRSYKKKNK